PLARSLALARRRAGSARPPRHPRQARAAHAGGGRPPQGARGTRWSRRVNGTPRPLLVAALGSGAAALIYETLWARSLAIVLGSTVQANALVFAAFLIGLAAGAYLFGRVADRFEHLPRAYALTEIG